MASRLPMKIVKSVIACVISGAADLAGQAVEVKQKGVDNKVDIARIVDVVSMECISFHRLVLFY